MYQHKKLSSLTRGCSLPIFTANETIANLMQSQLSQKHTDLLKAGLYFSIQPDKIQKSEIFSTFGKIHHSFLNNLKSEETKSQIKAHLSYLANSYFYNYKPSPRILRQHRVLRNLRKNKDIVITKPNKGNGVVILDQKLYNSTIQKIISDNSQFEQLDEDPTLKREKKTFLMKMNIINCILLVLLLLLYTPLLKYTNFPLVVHFLNFFQLFQLQVLLIITLPVSFTIFFHPQCLVITLAKILFLLFLKLRMSFY